MYTFVYTIDIDNQNTIQMANKSEKQLKDFITANGDVAKAFNLRPQGDMMWIALKNPINMAEVCIPDDNGKIITHRFGGIREKYYDKLQKIYAPTIGYKYSGGIIKIL